MSALLTLEWLRVHVGLPADDTTKDPEIELARITAIEIADSYCNRKFLYAEDSETFTHFIGTTLTLRRYPLAEIIDTHAETAPPYTVTYHIERLTGLMHLDAWAVQHALTVDYRGGYWIDDGGAMPAAPVFYFPNDLAMALVEMFDAAWSAQHRTIAQGGADGGGDVKQIRAGDLSISYDNEDSGAAVEYGFGDLLPMSAAGILLRYRRETA